MAPKRIHLVCSAHIDPVWLWHWEDGLTETLATYRTAADFCERHADFVFNHNEAVLYRWVQEYEPQLFRRIETLVHKGQWEISGGAYLQPDVNNSSGESHIQVVALKKSQKGERLIIRLQNTSSREREVTLQVKPFRGAIRLNVGAYSLATTAVQRAGKKLRWREVDLVERAR